MDVPPPAPGFVTVTFTVPAGAISVAGTVTTICVAVTAVGVVAGFAPKFTVAPVRKPLPFRVNTNAGPPAVMLAGDIDESVRVALVTVKLATVNT